MAKKVVYEIWPISWPEGNTLEHIMEHLEVLKFLDVDYVWVAPLYPSPRCDHGYDIADYKSIDPRFGTMKDFDIFVEVAHLYGIGVIMDLVLNHTSINHKWFKERPDYYFHTDVDFIYPGENLFDNGSIWEYSEQTHDHYLHLFHKGQADLDWFQWTSDKNTINLELVEEFRKIVRFWAEEHGVDGFRLDVPQAINKNLSSFKLDFLEMLKGKQSLQVINAIFPDKERAPFLMMECIDPTYGNIISLYGENTPIDYVCNIQLKDAIRQDETWFLNLIRHSCRNPYLMLELESHDSPRLPSRGNLTEHQCISSMFRFGPPAVCLYQGQELGLKNPCTRELTEYQMVQLDAQTAMRFKKGSSLRYLRAESRANARVPLPMAEYERQYRDRNSHLWYTKEAIEFWREY